MSVSYVSEKRLDIQGLRALAVMLVVITHVWPGRLSGGYVGVDVFFVISGYLITAHLLREVDLTGRVSLLRFWARRIRRLLPAAFAVILFCLVAAILVLPATAWPQTLREALASAFYVENWSLAVDSVDYMAAENDATMLQHFWSLSVEEQFYILWPLLILGVLWVGGILLRQRDAMTVSRRRWIIAGALVVVALASFATSVVWTDLSQSSAYFSTATRAWEFALGGLLSFIPVAASIGSARVRQVLHLAASWGGLALIAYAALRFDAKTEFPGAAAAIPVLGTALVIWAGDSAHRWSPAFASRFGPVQFIGDISYSVYLWHWPFVVLYLLLRGNEIGLVGGMLVIAASIAVGALSKTFIEDPFRRSTFWSKRVKRSFGFAVAGVAVTAMVTGAAFAGMSAMVASASEPHAPWASVAELQGEVTRTLSLDRFPLPDQPAGPQAQVDEWRIDDCVSVRGEDKRQSCVYGDPESPRRMVVVGDSFGTSLLPALRGAFGADYRIEPLTLGQCSPAEVDTHSWGSSKVSEGCLAHRADTLKRVSADKPDLIVIVDATESTLARVLGASTATARADLYIDGTAATYAAYAELGVPTVVIESAPKANCAPKNSFTAPRACKPTRTVESVIQVQARKQEAARAAGLGFVNLTSWLCSPDGVCPDQIGHMLTRADGAHLTQTFSASLSRLVRDAVLEELR
jgi:peptidoglycan/LPS O-acetylase OafA/YrhL